MMRLAQQAGENDLVFCLLSGGGSALTPAPSAGITLEEKQQFTSLLLACGDSIDEINTLRKHLSRLKGGQLARLVAPARLITLILSDVVGDRLDVIASGPTVPDASTFADCQKIISRYRLMAKLPPSIRSHLQRGCAGHLPETPKAGEPVFARHQTVLIGSNRTALQAAGQQHVSWDIRLCYCRPPFRARHVRSRVCRRPSPMRSARAACPCPTGMCARRRGNHRNLARQWQRRTQSGICLGGSDGHRRPRWRGDPEWGYGRYGWPNQCGRGGGRRRYDWPGSGLGAQPGGFFAAQ